MMRGYEDWFVGAVAMGTGVFLITVAAIHWRWYYSLTTSHLLQRWLGVWGTRCFHALLGILLVVLGGAIAIGFRFVAPN